LTITDVQATNVGNYVVTVDNGQALISSQPAFLQINSTGPDGAVEQVVAFNKLGDSVNLAPTNSSQPALAGSGQLQLSGFAPKIKHGPAPAPMDANNVQATGMSGTQIFSTSTSSRAGYFQLLASTSGPMLATTEGSDFNTICTVYTGPSNILVLSQLTQVARDVSSGYDHQTSRLSFNATSNQVYTVDVEGVNAAVGVARLGWVLGDQPVILEQPIGVTNAPGKTVVFNIVAGPASLTYQWLRNGTLLSDGGGISGSTGPILTLNNISSASAGVYEVTLSNANGTNTSYTAPLVVINPTAPIFKLAALTNSQFILNWSAQTGSVYQLQFNSDLTATNWMNLGNPITATSGIVNAFDVFNKTNGQRFYRAVLLP
jgi:hypothetical protein